MELRSIYAVAEAAMEEKASLLIEYKDGGTVGCNTECYDYVTHPSKTGYVAFKKHDEPDQFVIHMPEMIKKISIVTGGEV